MSRKLISDLFRLLRVISVLLVLFFHFLPETSKKHIWFELKCFCFFQMFCIQYFIWDSKTLRFPCCHSCFGLKIGWKKKTKTSEVRRLRLVSLRESDWHLENSRKQLNNSLPKVNMIFNSCSIGNASNMLSLTAVLIKAMIFCRMTAIKLM